jgi:hypothetical protein
MKNLLTPDPPDAIVKGNIQYFTGATMTELLEKAFAKAATLPALEQNIFANWILEELSSEQRWQAAFAASEDTLADLAAEALAEFKNNNTEPLSELL